jgi:hypothetical protein
MALIDDLVADEELTADRKVSSRTTKRWRDMPDGLPYIKLGNRIFYKRASLLEWIYSRERRPNPRRAA